MLLLAQLPDATQVVEKANSVSWEAGMLAIVIVTCMVALTYMIKRQNDAIGEERKDAKEQLLVMLGQLEANAKAAIDREGRLVNRIDELDDELRRIEREHASQMMTIIKEVSSAITESTKEREALGRDIQQLCELLRDCPLKRGEIREIKGDS